MPSYFYKGNEKVNTDV
uniref:Uncharacterized protein n=1 Tax=Lepeophtheirus salmonis TaxID=72036 RepID=A0A0K2UVE8_LEPSM